MTGYCPSSFWILGLQYISASLERLILGTNPTLVMLLGWLMYRRRFSRVQIGGMAISYLGVVLVFGHEIEVVGRNTTALGAALVFTSAVTYAIYLVYSGELVKRLGSLRLVGLATTVACLCCLLQFVLLRPMSAAPSTVAPEVIWAVGAECHARCAPRCRCCWGDDGDRAHRPVAGGADRHGGADVHHPDGRADPGEPFTAGRGGDGAGDCRHLRIAPRAGR